MVPGCTVGNRVGLQIFSRGVIEMNDFQPTVLFVDDEENILHSLKRLLRKEKYRILTATCGADGLDILQDNDVHLVVTDQRMPGMSGTEFLAKVKEKYPEVMRIVLSGYTEVDSITESINEGHIYKFMLKPWNDQNLKLEIKQALEQYDLMQVNKTLHEKLIEKNAELKKINENLEVLVKERTMDFEIQNQALELSRAILEDLPIPVMGISSEMNIVLINRKVETLSLNNKHIEIGKKLTDFFSSDVEEKIAGVLTDDSRSTLAEYRISDATYNLDFIPLSGRFRGKGVVMTLSPF
jgi:response regulator RpfG family c-di-GMP phosphodiesterase